MQNRQPFDLNFADQQHDPGDVPTRPRVGLGEPKLDQVAPDFTLPDYQGRDVSLKDFRGKKDVLLVFNRTFL